jgi:REP element-mobilizing transposase RayT
MQLAAFVFMPEHVHLLVVPTKSEPAIDRYLARIKQPFSKWVKQRLVDMKSSLINRLTVEERPGKTCFRFWQEGPGYDRNLTTPSVIEAAIQYIHMNPIRRVPLLACPTLRIEPSPPRAAASSSSSSQPYAPTGTNTSPTNRPSFAKSSH